MQEPKLVGFSELGLGFGQELSLLPNPGDKDLVFPCDLIGCLQNESLIVGPSATTGTLPRLTEGQRVIVRVMLAGGIALFPSTVLFVSDIPTVMIYLDYPRDIKFKQIRAALRVVVSLPILASNLDNSQLSGIPGRILDISTTGAGIQMFEKLGDVGQKIEMKGKFQVGEIQRLVTIKAVIRTVLKRKDEFSYGIEFHEADEEKLLVLLGYIFHAMAFGQFQSIR